MNPPIKVPGPRPLPAAMRPTGSPVPPANGPVVPLPTRPGVDPDLLKGNGR